MEYAFQFQNKTFTPDGSTDAIADVDAHNKQVEAAEIEWLKTHPDRVFLYVRHVPALMMDGHVIRTPYDAITTWLGTDVSSRVSLGGRVNVGFGFHTYRRSVDCRIFGVRYVGWYMESSGNYCRLRKAKRQ